MNLDELIEICCLMEATARKPGNVHPAASFDDLNFDDFVRSARAIGQPLALTADDGVGAAVLRAIEATGREAESNVNLGIALLLAPLCAVPREQSLIEGISKVIRATTVHDAEQVYSAIRIARPGGMGHVESQDVSDRPTVTLLEAMMLAADRDRIAEQYSTDFAYVLGLARPWLTDAWRWCHGLGSIIPKMDELLGLPGIVPWEAAIIRLQLKLLADAPDSLVVRKCGKDTANQLQQRAIEICRQDWPSRISSWELLHGFDEWLRADGHRRNPGTTADLIVATLFAAVREEQIVPPSRGEILQHAANIRQTTLKRGSHEF